MSRNTLPRGTQVTGHSEDGSLLWKCCGNTPTRPGRGMRARTPEGGKWARGEDERSLSSQQHSSQAAIRVWPHRVTIATHQGGERARTLH